MAKSVEQGNVVKEFKIVNTHIKICDDYCRDKTEKDVEKILEIIAQRALPHLVGQEESTCT